jgi:hypothetical protein
MNRLVRRVSSRTESKSRLLDNYQRPTEGNGLGAIVAASRRSRRVNSRSFDEGQSALAWSRGYARPKPSGESWCKDRVQQQEVAFVQRLKKKQTPVILFGLGLAVLKVNDPLAPMTTFTYSSQPPSITIFKEKPNEYLQPRQQNRPKPFIS